MASTGSSIKNSVTVLLIIFGFFIFGAVLGHFITIKDINVNEDMHYLSRQTRSLQNPCQLTTVQTETGENFYGLFTERINEKYACAKAHDECLRFGLRRNYNAYHLNQKSLIIDGKIDDGAWNEVPWSELFVDIRSEVYPKPYYETKFKLRWDDQNLYIAAFLQENYISASRKVNDSELWNENIFSVLIAADDSLFNYKQIDVNAVGTVTDLLLKKSYWDAQGQIVHDLKWDSKAKIAVYTPGTVNTPGDRDQYWSLEISIPFQTLADRTSRIQQQPRDNEVWFVQLARSQHILRLMENGKYEIAPNTTGSWWAWQPSGAVNLHLQDHWGLVQFKKTASDKKFEFQNWHIYKAMFDVLDAMKVFKAKYGIYTTALGDLDLPPYLLSRTCVDLPEIRLRENRSEADFDINVRSMLFNYPPAHIRSDKFVKFM